MESRKKMLIIDNEEEVITYLSAFFAYNNFYVVSAVCGLEGVKMALSEKPDIIVLNPLMPEETGLNALHELQKNPGTKNIPIVIIGGCNSDLKKIIDQKKQTGMPKGHFEKPVDRDALLKKITEMLKV